METPGDNPHLIAVMLPNCCFAQRDYLLALCKSPSISMSAFFLDLCLQGMHVLVCVCAYKLLPKFLTSLGYFVLGWNPDCVR